MTPKQRVVLVFPFCNPDLLLEGFKVAGLDLGLGPLFVHETLDSWVRLFLGLDLILALDVYVQFPGVVAHDACCSSSVVEYAADQ